MKKITLAVLFGGSSTEYEISLKSAHAVLTHLDRDRYEPVLLGITRDGRWLLYQGPVDALLDEELTQLSSGQKQRVAIGSALMCGKDLIIFDEPTSGLDRYHMEQVGELLRQLASQGKAILVVTHDEELTAGWCDRIVNLGADDSGNNGSHVSNPDASSPSPNASTNFATTSTHERNAQ